MTTISALPAVPNRADPANFATRADALLTALPTFVTQTNTVASEVNAARTVVETAMSAGLASAATNAATCVTKAAASAVSEAAALAAAVAASAAWSAALAANPDLDPVVRMNPSIIAIDTTIPSYYNAYSAGPLTIGDSVAVTLNDNSNWSVL